jgi:hypothetical protein
MTNNLASLSIDQLRRAIALKEQIEQLADELKGVLGSAPIKRGRRTRSAATRARMAAAQRARWAGAKGKSPKKAKRGKRKISAAGRARIAAAAKARWAAAKRAGKRTLAG